MVNFPIPNNFSFNPQLPHIITNDSRSLKTPEPQNDFHHSFNGLTSQRAATPVMTTPRVMTPTDREEVTFFSPVSYPPITPAKKSAQHEKVAQVYLDIHSTLAFGSQLLWQERNMQVQFLANGDFCNAYTIIDGPFSGHLVKAFHERRIAKDALCLNEFMRHSLNQYHTLQSLNVKVATIFNAATALRDNFYVVEYIASPLNYDPEKKFHDLTHAEMAILKQVRGLFELAFAHNLHLDLLPRNLRQTENGEVVLVDFLEEPFDEMYADYVKRFRVWGNDPKISAFLTENLPESFQRHLSWALSR